MDCKKKKLKSISNHKELIRMYLRFFFIAKYMALGRPIMYNWTEL